MADLITTCYGGRNARLSKEFVIQKKSIAVLEAELLNGQKMQGRYKYPKLNLKIDIPTGKSFSEALILASVNPQYDERLFIDLQEK